ncbi:hypothetical protein GC175_14320 [bacterium]|nr:hypothetical protein [bacterium]
MPGVHVQGLCRRFRVWSFVFTLLAVMLVFTACAAPVPAAMPADSGAVVSTEDAATATGDVPRERTLIIAYEGGPVAAPDLANPYISGNRINQGYHQASIESLFYLNYETGEMVPWQAESYTFNDDFTEVTVTLREGVTWSDGMPFTAEDVVFTVNMLQEHPILNYGTDMQQWVESVEAVDERTVRFTLTTSYPRFLVDFFAVRIWGMVRIVPAHIWADQDPETFRNYDPAQGWPVWTGPYQVVKVSENEFVYDRRGDWWGAETGFHALPAPERLIFVEQGPSERGAAQLEANDIDAHTRMPLGLFETIQSRNPNIIGWFAERPYGWIDPCPRTFFLNTQKAPWDDADMRWALSHALNRQAVGEAELGGPGAIPAAYTFPDYPPLRALMDEHADLWDQYPVTEFNPDKSIEIFESKGYVRGNDGIFTKDGERLQITLLLSSDWPPGSQIAPLMVGFWQAVGIDATANFLSGSQLNDMRNMGDFDVLIVSPCYSIVDPFNEVDAFHGRHVVPLGERASMNFGRWSSPEFDAIVDEMATLPAGDPALSSLWREAMEIWLPELPVLPMYQQVRIVPLNTTYWTNWPTAENNYIHPPTWWASTLQMIMNVQPAQ